AVFGAICQSPRSNGYRAKGPQNRSLHVSRPPLKGSSFSCDNDSAYRLRISFLSTFPAELLGSSSQKSTDFGFLKPASLLPHRSMISASVALAPTFRTTTALATSPQCSSGNPTTDASETAGWP